MRPWKPWLRRLGLGAVVVGGIAFTIAGIVGVAVEFAHAHAATHKGEATSAVQSPPMIRVAVGGAIPTLDPAKADDTESISAVQLIYQPLFTYGTNGHLVGLLASSWSWSNNDQRLTVQINPAAHFSDGSPVTAADVVFSLDRMLDASTGAPEAQSFSALVGYAQLRQGDPSSGIIATGTDTVVFTLTSPLPSLTELLAMPSASIVEEQLVSQSAASSAQWWFANSAGSGPYVLGPYTSGISLQLHPSPDFWMKGDPGPTGVTEGPYAGVLFQVVSSPATQLQLFKAGRLDVLDPLGPSQEKELGTLPAGAKLLEGSALGLSYLGFNTSKTPFNVLDVRLAAAYALNKPALLKAAGGVGQVASGLIPPGIAGRKLSLAPYAYDPQKAAALLQKSGLSLPIPVVLLTIASSGTVQQGINDSAAQLVAKELDAVGFSVAVRAESWQSYYDDLQAGQDNLYQGSWLADYPSAQDFFFNLLDSASIGVNNDTFFSDPAFDALDAQAASTVTTSVQDALFERLDQLVYQEVPLLPEIYEDTAVLVSARLSPATLQTFIAPPLMPRYDLVQVLGSS